MKKKLKFIVIFLIGFGITISGLISGLNWYVQQQLNKTTINITSVQILDLSNNQMKVKMGLNLSEVTYENISFDIGSIKIKYKEMVFDNISLSQTRFTINKEIQTTIATIGIENDTAFDELVNDFLILPKLNFTIITQIAFTGIMRLIPRQTIEKNFTMDGIIGFIPEIQSFDLLDATTDKIIFNLTLGFYNPTIMNCTLSDLWIDILHSGIKIGNVSHSLIQFNAGNNLLSVNLSLGGDKNILDQILGNYIMGKTTILTLIINTAISISNSTSKYDLHNTRELIFQGNAAPIVSINDLKIGIQINLGLPTIVTFVTKVNVTMHNPLSFAINISNFIGDLFFDDSDGYNRTLFENTSQNHIFIDHFNYNETWAGVPRQLPPKSEKNEIVIMTPQTNRDLGLRLYDEQEKDQLFVDVENGILDVQIGAFYITIRGLSFPGYLYSTSLTRNSFRMVR